MISNIPARTERVAFKVTAEEAALVATAAARAGRHVSAWVREVVEHSLRREGAQ